MVHFLPSWYDGMYWYQSIPGTALHNGTSRVNKDIIFILCRWGWKKCRQVIMEQSWMPLKLIKEWKNPALQNHHSKEKKLSWYDSFDIKSNKFSSHQGQEVCHPKCHRCVFCYPYGNFNFVKMVFFLFWIFWKKDAGLSVILRLAFQSIGVVYGDMGTSPLYVYASTFPSGIKHNDDILGVLSLIIYTVILIPLIKYVFIVLHANDNGDGNLPSTPSPLALCNVILGSSWSSNFFFLSY